MKKSQRNMNLLAADREKTYLSNLCIASAQVFLGISAATFFTAPPDFGRILVIVSNLLLAIWFAILGRRVIK